MKKEVNRRQFIASSLGIGVATAVGTVLGSEALPGVEKAFADEGETVPVTQHDNMPVEITKDYKRFDQRNTIFSRGCYDKKIIPHSIGFHEKEGEGKGICDEPGWTHKDWALERAAWAMHDYASPISAAGLRDMGVFTWRDYEVFAQKCKFENIEEATKILKRAATFVGADLVGIADYDERWVYSKFYDLRTNESSEEDFPFKPKHVIAIAIEMDYEAFKTAPSQLATAAAGVGYSAMAEVTHKLATFIRKLGYKAIASGNDTALSVPIAVQAGLGEVGRNGVLITPKYGPRVRLCKVFTDMPLKADKPITFGVEKFCETCKKCAELCPSQSIPMDDKPTMKGTNISNNDGVRKWYVDAEKCYEFWGKNGGDCGSCIAGCPYNKLPVWNHKFALEMTKTPVRAILPPMDDLFGYGKTYNTKEMIKFWEK